MHRLITATVFFISTAIMHSAYAAEWDLYFQNTVNVSFFIDTSSVVHLENGYVRAWQKQVPKDGDGFMYLLEVDCKQRRQIIRSITPINSTLENLHAVSAMMSVYSGWSFFEPNDLDEATYAKWCSNAKK